MADDPKSYLLNPHFKEVWGDAKEITPTDALPDGAWYFPPLYKKHASGKKWIVWIIGFDGVDRVVSVSGQLGGNLRANPAKIKVKRGKSSVAEQAHSDARGKYNKKIVQGSHLWGEKSFIIKPMLAEIYQDVKIPANAWPVAVQPKLDGMRALAKLVPRGTENKSLATDSKLLHSVEIQSRNGKYIKLADHIALAIQPLFAYLPTGAVLDGEIYIHNDSRISPQEISGLIGPNTKERNPLILLLKYYIYDLIVEDVTYEDRFKLLASALLGLAASEAALPNKAEIFYILNYTPAHDEKELTKIHEQHVILGYEGSMVRRLANGAQSGDNYTISLYKHGRSKGLLKYKDWRDEEGTITGYHFAKGGDKEDALVFEVRDPRGNIISVSMIGSNKTWKDAAVNPERFIGLTLNYKYQNLTDDGKARFPIGRYIRDKSGEGVEEEVLDDIEED